MAKDFLQPHPFGMPGREEIAATAERLRRARMAINPNQTEFARGAGLQQNRYNQYETGARPLTLDAAVRLCNAYGLTLDYLFRGDTTFVPHGLIESLRRQGPDKKSQSVIFPLADYHGM